MRIAIAGAGISGLALYLFFEKHGVTQKHSVSLIEKRDTTSESDSGQDHEVHDTSVIGASIGLSATGLKVLARLDQTLYDEILSTGHVLRRCKISNSRGWILADVPIGAANEIVLMIGREAFWHCLKKRVPQQAMLRKTVMDIVASDEDSCARIIFRNGEYEEADLIVGADGVWSTVRKAISRAQGEDPYKFSPQYEGLVGVGGFVSSSKLVNVPAGEMNIVFGGNGFFGYTYTEELMSENSILADKAAVWWSTYTLETCPDDWRRIDRGQIKRQLDGRHSFWRNHTIQRILNELEVDSLYPTFTTPLLPTWNDSRCVVIGDAAHALQPSSGQGASMALEDAETLALLLEHFLDRDPRKGHQKAIDNFSRLRMPRLKMVHIKAQEVGSMKQDMNLLQEMVMHFFIWLVNALGLNESYNRKLNNYDVPSEVQRQIASEV